MAQAETHRQYRIASYNIRKARGLDGARHPGRILDVINKLGADVIALQEADHRLGPRPAAIPRGLIAEHTDFDVVDVAANDVSLGWHGNAILVRKSLAVKRVERLTLPGVEPRGAVAVTLAGGPTLVGLHLGLLRSSRRRQLARIVSHFGCTGDVVLAGDMNEWAARRGFEPLSGKLKLYAPGRSFHAARPVAALDRIALGGNLALRDAGVDESPLARIASDHLPIWADVAYRMDAGAVAAA